MSRVDLEGLRWKYEEMRRLRVLRARARSEPGFVEPDPSSALAELARRFPGALRELDQLPLDIIERRIEALHAAEVDPACEATWMRASSAFHRLARGALAAKRWVSVSDSVSAARFESELASLEHGDDARAWADDLAAIARPPRGRLMDLVYARLAEELGVDVAAAKAALR